MTDGPASAAPTLRRAVNAFVSADISAEDALPLGLAGPGGRQHLVGRRRLARDARPAGPARPRRPARSTSCRSCWAHWARPSRWSGDFAAASALIVEADAVCGATGTRAAPFTAMMLASLRGRQAEATALIEATIAEADSRRPGHRGGLRALGGRRPAQRPGPLHRSPDRGRSGQRGHLRTAHLHVGAARAGRGRRPQREHAPRRRRRSNGWRSTPRRAGPTSDWGSRRVPARC